FSSRRRHTRFSRDWSSDVCSSDLELLAGAGAGLLIVLLTGGLDVMPVAMLALLAGLFWFLVDSRSGRRFEVVSSPQPGAAGPRVTFDDIGGQEVDRKSTRLNSSHVKISYAVFCL